MLNISHFIQASIKSAAIHGKFYLFVWILCDTMGQVGCEGGLAHPSLPRQHQDLVLHRGQTHFDLLYSWNKIIFVSYYILVSLKHCMSCLPSWASYGVSIISTNSSTCIFRKINLLFRVKTIKQPNGSSMSYQDLVSLQPQKHRCFGWGIPGRQTPSLQSHFLSLDNLK